MHTDIQIRNAFYETSSMVDSMVRKLLARGTSGKSMTFDMELITDQGNLAFGLRYSRPHGYTRALMYVQGPDEVLTYGEDSGRYQSVPAMDTEFVSMGSVLGKTVYVVRKPTLLQKVTGNLTSLGRCVIEGDLPVTIGGKLGLSYYHSSGWDSLMLRVFDLFGVQDVDGSPQVVVKSVTVAEGGTPTARWVNSQEDTPLIALLKATAFLSFSTGGASKFVAITEYRVQDGDEVVDILTESGYNRIYARTQVELDGSGRVTSLNGQPLLAPVPFTTDLFLHEDVTRKSQAPGHWTIILTSLCLDPNSLWKCRPVEGYENLYVE